MQYGSKNISELQYGSKNIIAAYWGSKKVWELGNVEDYCTIEALEDGLTVSFSNTVKYSTNCKIWKTLEANTISKEFKSGQKLYFKANLTPTSENGIGTEFYFTLKQINIIRFISIAKCKIRRFCFADIPYWSILHNSLLECQTNRKYCFENILICIFSPLFKLLLPR